MPPTRAAGIATLAALIAAPTAALCAPGAQGALVPPAVLKQVDQAFLAPRQKMTQAQYYQYTAAQMAKVLDIGLKAEKAYPQAKNLYVLQLRMLMAADFLSRTNQSPQVRHLRLALARRILSSGAPMEAKLTPDYFVTSELVRPTSAGPPPTAEKEIRAFVDRYADTAEKPAALARGVQLAAEAQQKRLHWHLLNALEKDYAHIPSINVLLRRNGRRPPFVAALTLIDGRKLTLPDDLQGKVTVVHFWATWSIPCTVGLANLKRAYDQYHDKGVAFLSVNLDKAEDKPKVLETIRRKNLTWLHAFSGKHLEDPTARRYGVRSLPGVWVIGKDGKIFSDNARFNLARTLYNALSQPTPKPGSPAKDPEK